MELQVLLSTVNHKYRSPLTEDLFNDVHERPSCGGWHVIAPNEANTQVTFPRIPNIDHRIVGSTVRRSLALAT